MGAERVYRKTGRREGFVDFKFYPFSKSKPFPSSPDYWSHPRRRIEPEPGYVNENGHGHANGHEPEHVNEKNLLVCVPVYGLGLGLDPPIRENSRKFGLAP